MDQLSTFLERFGFPILCAVAVGWAYWKVTSNAIRDMRSDISKMQDFERDTLTGLVREGHIREREFLHVIRNERQACPLINRDATPEPHPYAVDPNDTQTVLDAVRERHRTNPKRRSGEH